MTAVGSKKWKGSGLRGEVVTHESQKQQQSTRTSRTPTHWWKLSLPLPATGGPGGFPVQIVTAKPQNHRTAPGAIIHMLASQEQDRLGGCCSVGKELLTGRKPRCICTLRLGDLSFCLIIRAPQYLIRHQKQNKASSRPIIKDRARKQLN